MEYRDDLERLLFAGLSDSEQQETAESMANATASKLTQLQSAGPADDDLADEQDRVGEPS